MGKKEKRKERRCGGVAQKRRKGLLYQPKGGKKEDRKTISLKKGTTVRGKEGKRGLGVSRQEKRDPPATRGGKKKETQNRKVFPFIREPSASLNGRLVKMETVASVN